MVNGKYHKCPGHGGGGGHTTYHGTAPAGHTHPGEHSHTHTHGGSTHTHTHDHDNDHSHGDGHTRSPGVGPHEHASQEHVHTKLKVEEQSHPAWPSKVLGLYILLADDDEDGFDSKAEWNPELFPWQQKAANVLFFTFIHPGTMEVPPSFQKLAASRGNNAEVKTDQQTWNRLTPISFPGLRTFRHGDHVRHRRLLLLPLSQPLALAHLQGGS